MPVQHKRGFTRGSRIATSYRIPLPSSPSSPGSQKKTAHPSHPATIQYKTPLQSMTLSRPSPRRIISFDQTPNETRTTSKLPPRPGRVATVAHKPPDVQHPRRARMRQPALRAGHHHLLLLRNPVPAALAISLRILLGHRHHASSRPRQRAIIAEPAVAVPRRRRRRRPRPPPPRVARRDLRPPRRRPVRAGDSAAAQHYGARSRRHRPPGPGWLPP